MIQGEIIMSLALNLNNKHLPCIYVTFYFFLTKCIYGNFFFKKIKWYMEHLLKMKMSYRRRNMLIIDYFLNQSNQIVYLLF